MLNMNTKIVYIVTGNEKNSYVEQAFLSIYSLRLYNPDAYVCLVTDSDTKKYIEDNRRSVLQYITEIIAFELPKDIGNLRKSRYLKTNLRNLIKGDFLFIDSDTIILKSLDDIDKLEYNIAAVADSHLNISCYPLKRSLYKWAQIANFKVDENKPYINSGVMYVKDTEFCHEFYEEWHKQWLLTSEQRLYSDQASLAKTNELFDYPIQLLGGEWNCQIVENGLKYLDKAYIIHYFASGNDTKKQSPYKLYDQSIYQTLKDGEVTPEVDYMVKNAKSAFVDQCKIVTGDDVLFLNSIIHSLYQRNKMLYQFFEKQANIIKKINDFFS